MSDSIRTVNKYDPRINIKAPAQYTVQKGATQETFNVFPSNSFSNSQVNFLPTIPSEQNVVSRNALMTFYYEVSLTGTTDQTTMSDCIGLLLAPRANPNANVIQTIKGQINNDSVSMNLANNISALQRYNNYTSEYKTDLSTYPSMNDFYQRYEDGQGSNNNPLGLIGSSYEQPRGGFGTIEVISSSPTALTFRFSSTEPLYLSPFTLEESHSAGFYGVNTLNVNAVLSNLNRAVSIDTGSTTPNIVVSTISTTLYRNPELLLTFLTPPMDMQIPRSLPYAYSSVNEYATEVQSAISGGANFTISSQVVQLSSVPQRAYVYARRSDGTLSYDTSDVFARLNSISIDYDVQSGLLSGANSLQLYKMSAYNGYNGSFSQWSRYTGSVLALDFGRDIPLADPLEAVGRGNIRKTFKVTGNFTNLNPDAVTYSLYIVIVSEGLFTIEGGQASSKLGPLSAQDVLDAADTVDNDQPRPDNFYGASLFSKAVKALKKGVQYAPAAIRAAEQYSRGDVFGAAETVAKAAKKKGKGLVGGRGLVGGQMMSRQDLMERRGMMHGGGSGVKAKSSNDIYSGEETF